MPLTAQSTECSLAQTAPSHDVTLNIYPNYVDISTDTMATFPLINFPRYIVKRSNSKVSDNVLTNTF
jgi:hypothetical protein